jgi:S1-C subfamily serine protease
VRVQPDTNLPTDATSFFQAGVPIVSAFTGSHEDYHSPRDTPDKLDYERTAQIADFMEQLARSVSARETPPAFIEPRVETPAVASRGSRVYLGTIPDYAASVNGMQISGVTKGAPADQAGLKSKDVIVELAGKKIENIHDYMAAMDALKIGEKVTIVVVRNNERVSLEIVPGSRQ